MVKSVRTTTRSFSQPPSKMEKLSYFMKSVMKTGKHVLGINKKCPSDVSIVHGHAINGSNNPNEGYVYTRNAGVGSSNALFLGVFQECKVDVLDCILNMRFDEDEDEEGLKYEAKRAAKDVFYRGLVEKNKGGCAYLFVLSNNKFIGAYSGEYYRVVVCNQGRAIHVKTPNAFLKDLMAGITKHTHRFLPFSLDVEPGIEFVILGSNGLWKNIKTQESVDLIRNVEEPESAAQQLVELANNRAKIDSAGGFPISCVVIRCKRNVPIPPPFSAEEEFPLVY